MHYLSRREFLIKTAIGAASAAGVGTLSAAAEDSPRLPVVIFSKVYQSLNLSFEDAASVTAEASLNGVDCPVRPAGEVLPEKVVDDLPRYAEALRKQGLGLPLLTTAIITPASPQAEKILRTAKKVGVQFYRTGFIERQRDKTAQAQIAEARAQFKDLAAMNKEIGIGAIVQNHSPAGHTILGAI